MNWYIFIIGIVLSLACLLPVIIILFRPLRIRESNIGQFIIKVLLVGFISLLAFLCLEVFFRFFVIQSDNFNFTLGSKLWHHRYWNPINSFGYRDVEHHESDLLGKKIIFVVGDSYAAGAGVKNYKDRFPNVLQEKLGSNYEVITIAKLGWATDDEYQAIIDYPYKPNIIILSYCNNDILGPREESEMRNFIKPPTLTLATFFVNTSYAFSYFYWRLYNRTKLHRFYSASIKNCFLNEKIFQKHKNSVLNIINYAKNNNVELIVITLPIPRKIVWGEPLVGTKPIYPMIDFFKQNEVKVVYWPKEIIMRNQNTGYYFASAVDTHPNAKLHKEIANLLYEYIVKSHKR